MPFYAVARGQRTGIFNSWDECSAMVNGYSGSAHKKFATHREAEAYLSGFGRNLVQDNTKTSNNVPGNSLKGSRISKSSIPPSLSLRSQSYKRRPSQVVKNPHDLQTQKSTILQLSGSLATSRSDSFDNLTLYVNRKPQAMFDNSKHNLTPDCYYSATTVDRSTEKIYVDGACRGNGQKRALPASGYGVYYGQNDPRNAAVSLAIVDPKNSHKHTNNRAELLAANHALTDIANRLSSELIKDPKYVICTDSKYTMQALKLWSGKWMQNGWKTSTGADVLNKDIIQDSVLTMNYVNDKYRQRGWGSLDIEYVKGHAGIHGNEQADRLANLGADAMELE